MTSAALQHPLVADGLVAALLYALGKLTAAAISGKRQTARWVFNWAVCGVMDGVCTHHWYHFIQSAADATTWGSMSKALAMTATSNLIYTPVYCAAFLFVLSLLEGKGVLGAKARVRLDLEGMLWKSLKVWGPTNFILFAFVPLQIRTLTSMAIHYLFLVGLALWDHSLTVNRQTATWSATSKNEFPIPQAQLQLATAFVPIDDQQLEIDAGPAEA